MVELLFKALIGAAIVVVIQLLAQTRHYYVAGLVPLFPTFALIAHYIVGQERTTGELKQTVLFGMFSLLPYFVYLLTLYFLIDRWRLAAALLGAVVAWTAAATVLVVLWNK
jgi:membrane protein GlpM